MIGTSRPRPRSAVLTGFAPVRPTGLVLLLLSGLAVTGLAGCGQAGSRPGAGSVSEATADATLGSMAFDGGPDEPVRDPEACRVTRIVDGDTLHCEPVGRIRLIGMDAPERDQRPFGLRATDALEALVPVGSTVEIEPDVERVDPYGRVLGYVWTRSGMVNWLLVRSGYAVVLTYPPNVQYVDEFRSAQTSAREEGQGLWAVDGFACEPREHRRGAC